MGAAGLTVTAVLTDTAAAASLVVRTSPEATPEVRTLTRGGELAVGGIRIAEWLVSAVDGAEVRVNGVLVIGGRHLAPGDEITEGPCRVTIHAPRPDFRPPGPRANGFSRARYHAARALALAEDERAFVEKLAELEVGISHAESLATIQPAVSEMKLERWTTALELLDAVLNRTPQHAAALLHRAICLGNLARLDEAVASARAAQACESADEELRTAAGNILKQLDESGPAVLLGGAIKQMTAEAFEEAERLLEAAAARFPKDASILFHLAICQQRLKRGTKAGETLARAEAFAREPQLVEAIRSMKEQLAHAGVLDDAVARLGRNDFAGAAAAFERVPAAVRERPDIKLLYCLARARVLADNPYAANRQSKLRAIAAELRDVKQRTDDAQVRSQAEALLAQLRNAGIY